jgi:hypothetical protein
VQVVPGEISGDFDGFVPFGSGGRSSDVFLDQHGPERIGEITREYLLHFIAFFDEGIVVLLQLLDIDEHVVVEGLLFLLQTQQIAVVGQTQLFLFLEQSRQSYPLLLCLADFFRFNWPLLRNWLGLEFGTEEQFKTDCRNSSENSSYGHDEKVAYDLQTCCFGIAIGEEGGSSAGSGAHYDAADDDAHKGK